MISSEKVQYIWPIETTQNLIFIQAEKFMSSLIKLETYLRRSDG